MYKNIALLLVIFVPLIFAAMALTAIVQRRIRPYYATMTALSKHFPGGLSRFQRFFMHQPSFVGAFSGHKFSATYTTDTALHVWHLQLICHVSSPGKLKIFMYDRNPGTVLFAKKIQTGDHDFDKYFIYSNRPNEARRYFADDAKRENIKRLVADGWLPPGITGKKIYTSSQARPGPDLDPEMLRTALKNLMALRIEHI